MFIKVTNSFFRGDDLFEEGKVRELPDRDAKIVIAMGKAVETDPPAKEKTNAFLTEALAKIQAVTSPHDLDRIGEEYPETLFNKKELTQLGKAVQKRMDELHKEGNA